MGRRMGYRQIRRRILNGVHRRNPAGPKYGQFGLSQIGTANTVDIVLQTPNPYFRGAAHMNGSAMR